MKIYFFTDGLPLETQRALYLELKDKFERPSIVDPALTGDELLNANLEDVAYFDTHIFNLLKFARIQTVRELTQTSEQYLCSIRGFGNVSLQKVKDFLDARGLALTREY
ncbi:MAG TPA: DNA-directed RNA polymerase subunit alpha C-terminal domain-containing protein [Puia sp.]|uniref:DNA-directed RNA polymerase subunit alpha C-terminal domain-containing protein n=1 Tax=Puia sp. TaxID=2045100 RepID=UPI002BAC88F9|nr:DNA-directed RNA polymerase subunit alpha C-terminal domain-containing protein [Puia sp.]HVU97737.1 DNA-directed RNA polymerase subunit alpha C-terminal domain-containing protein [Puia sp.]